MTRLHDLYTQQRQSPWLDNLRRSWLHSGEIQEWIDAGVRGITSNPSIFQKAIESAVEYDEQFFAAIAAGSSVEDTYWQLVMSDISEALALLRPTFDESAQTDGFVSVEVSPALAHDQAGTEEAARFLWNEIDAPNLLVKIPATQAGVGAVRTAISEAISVNVTLIFSLDRYDAVIDAYIEGLEQLLERGVTDLSGVNSVASFFISRVDSEVDARLQALDTEEATALIGTAAVAQGQLAYELAMKRFSGARWERLAQHGARIQRPLWASTSTKNPSFPDTKYVDDLIGPDTVNTIPDPTLVAFQDHGTVARTLDADLAGARARWERLGELVDLVDVAEKLEREGVASFMKAFDELLEVLEKKAAAS